MTKRKEPDIQFQLAVPPRRQRTPAPPKPTPQPPIPRLTRLLALAIKFEGLVRQGAVRDYADLARLGHVTRARMTQIMHLLDLAPDIQEAILLEQPAVTERELRAVTRQADWSRQREAWRLLLGSHAAASKG